MRARPAIDEFISKEATMADQRAGGELTADELEAQDVAQLPNREAMSLISTGAVPLPIEDGGAATDIGPSDTVKDPGRMPPGTDPPSYDGGVEYLGPPVSSTDAT